MADNKLVLKSINQLLEYNFFIPSYQRGYRWSETQVTQLLDDVWEFSQKDKSGEEFYCLQPIVVKAQDWKDSDGNAFSGWEVIDGQQRLTTIRIILSYLVKKHLKRPLKEAFLKEEFTIYYDTRPTSEAFLKDLKEDNSNIDFYHMWSAYETTEDWFGNKDYNDCNKILSTLLAREDKENPVKVIWYEINDEVDAIDIFTRLNIGKIPLTNSELIRALFLGTANPNNQNQLANHKQLQIATEWDAIENTLQDKSFWFFIFDKDNDKLPQHNYDTRIEYIFDLIKNKEGGEEKYFTFYKFLLEDFEKKKTPDGKPDIEAIWREIKRYFLTFEEWYHNRELYHLVGFLIATGSGLKKLKNKAGEQKMTKKKFKEYLRKKVAEKINFDIENLDYNKGKDKALIHRIFLLFNIQTLLANGKSKSRFPFDSYKNEDWEIEHVRSQSEKTLKGTDRIEWAKLVLEFYTGIAVNLEELDLQKSEIDKLNGKKEKRISNGLIDFLQNGSAEDEFILLYEQISKSFKEENPPASHSIANLTLLDAGTNRAYKNAFFPIKRMVIMKREMNGYFVPVSTKNLFLKAYSRRFDKIMYWNKTDADDYMKAIKSSLDVYLNPKAN